MRGSSASSQPAASPEHQNPPGTLSKGSFAVPPQSPTSPSVPWGRTAQPRLLPRQHPKPGTYLHSSRLCKNKRGCHAKPGDPSREPRLSLGRGLGTPTLRKIGQAAMVSLLRSGTRQGAGPPPSPGGCIPSRVTPRSWKGWFVRHAPAPPLLPPFAGWQPLRPRAKRMCEIRAQTSCRRASFPTAQMHLGAARAPAQPPAPDTPLPLHEGGQAPRRGLGHGTEQGRRWWLLAQPRAAAGFEGSFRLR